MSRERPILFSAPMVRAILDGRKTQTRRVVRWQGPRGYPHSFEHAEIDNPAGVKRLLVPLNHPSAPTDPWWENGAHRHYCPHGDPGDFLWVRETWRVYGGQEYEYQHEPRSVQFRADDGHLLERDWRPSIFMPRWASRLTLEITGVRVQRLHEITEADALAEGCIKLPASGRITDTQGGQYAGRLWWTARAWYEELWQSLNAKRAPWASNPWVWVVEFRKIDA